MEGGLDENSDNQYENYWNWYNFLGLLWIFKTNVEWALSKLDPKIIISCELFCYKNRFYIILIIQNNGSPVKYSVSINEGWSSKSMKID